LGWALAEKIGSTTESGWTWDQELSILLKSQPDGLVGFCSIGLGMG
jgi:hypothetical protein